MAYNYGNLFAGQGPQQVGDLGIIDPSRLQTSASGGAYIGGMAPQLPTQDMSFMWGGNGATSSAPAAPTTGGWNQASVGPGGLGQTEVTNYGPSDSGQFNAAGYAPPSSGGGSSVNLQGYSQNPYLTQMGEGLRDQFTGFMNDGLAANRGSAVAAGGVGGSRQGIAEARTMTDAGKGFNSALANLYGTDYNNQMNRNLQQYGMDQSYALGNRNADLGFLNSDRSYDLGLGGLALGNKNADNSLNLGLRGQDITWQNNVNNTMDNRQLMRDNFYTSQRGQDLTGQGIATNFYSNLLNTAASPGGVQMSNNGFDWQKAAGGYLAGQQTFNNIFKT